MGLDIAAIVVVRHPDCSLSLDQMLARVIEADIVAGQRSDGPIHCPGAGRGRPDLDDAAASDTVQLVGLGDVVTSSRWRTYSKPTRRQSLRAAWRQRTQFALSFVRVEVQADQLVIELRASKQGQLLGRENGTPSSCDSGQLEADRTVLLVPWQKPPSKRRRERGRAGGAMEI